MAGPHRGADGVGYAGYYLCRSNLSVMLLSIAEELTARGLSTQCCGCERTPGMGCLFGDSRLCDW